MGATGVEAIKPEDGYIAFAGTSVSQVVTLTPDQSFATVVLKLGPKAGILIPHRDRPGHRKPHHGVSSKLDILRYGRNQ